MNIFDCTITELSKLIYNKEILPSEIVSGLIERINKYDKHLNSYEELTFEHAKSHAKKADEEIMSGNYLGPLHGVPINIKDIFNMKGTYTKMGTVIYNKVSRDDSALVTKLREAGAILMGKASLTEGAMGGYNSAFKVPVNPWSKYRHTGGSSSGSAVSVAAGLSYGSIGTDTLGSIRFPSASCGLVGLKPTCGAIDNKGTLGLSKTLDHIGPIVRCSNDALIMFNKICKFKQHGLNSLKENVKIGIDEEFISKDTCSQLSEIVKNQADLLSDIGYKVVKIKLPNLEEFLQAAIQICAYESYEVHKMYFDKTPEKYGAWFRDWLALGKSFSYETYKAALLLRIKLKQEFKTIFETTDVIICPSMSSPPICISEKQLYGPMQARPLTFHKFTSPFNLTGLPTLSLPAGFIENMPQSFQLVSNYSQERLLCAIGSKYEKGHNMSFKSIVNL